MKACSRVWFHLSDTFGHRTQWCHASMNELSMLAPRPGLEACAGSWPGSRALGSGPLGLRPCPRLRGSAAGLRCGAPLRGSAVGLSGAPGLQGLARAARWTPALQALAGDAWWTRRLGALVGGQCGSHSAAVAGREVGLARGSWINPADGVASQQVCPQGETERHR